MAHLGRFMTQLEREYFEKRQKAVSKLEQTTLIDNPFLFASRFLVNDMLLRIELFKRTIDISGAIVECGVASGNHLMLFAHLSSILEPYAINRRIIGFDSFSGFRSISSKDPRDITEDDFGDTSAEVIRKAIKLYDMNRAVSHMKRVEIVEGDATKTIHEYVDGHPELSISLLYLDFDIYEPTKVALEHFLPLVPKGGVVAFDELNLKKWSGETQALKEFIDLKTIKLEKCNFDPWSSYYVVGA